MRSRHYASDAQPKNKYYLRDLNTGEEIEILDGLQTPYGFAYTDDNMGFYFIAIQSSDPEWDGAGISELYYYDLSSKTYQQVDLNWPWGIGGGIEAIGSDVIVSLANGATNRIMAYKKSSNSWERNSIDLEERNDHIIILDVSDDGNSLVYEYSTNYRSTDILYFRHLE